VHLASAQLLAGRGDVEAAAVEAAVAVQIADEIGMRLVARDARLLLRG
jgi:hypothetical protein